MKKDMKCDDKKKGEKMMKDKSHAKEEKKGMKELRKEAPRKEKGEMKNADMGKEYSKYKKMKK